MYHFLFLQASLHLVLRIHPFLMRIGYYLLLFLFPSICVFVNRNTQWSIILSAVARRWWLVHFGSYLRIEVRGDQWLNPSFGTLPRKRECVQGFQYVQGLQLQGCCYEKYSHIFIFSCVLSGRLLPTICGNRSIIGYCLRSSSESLG